MGSDKPNNEDKPPSFSFPLQEDHNALTIGLNGTADCSKIFHSNIVVADPMSFPNMSLPAAPNLQCYSHDIAENSGNMMEDFMMVNSLTNFTTGPNSRNARIDLPRFVRVSDISPPVENVRGMHQPTSHNNMVSSDNVMLSGSHLGGFQSPQMSRKCLSMTSNTSGAYLVGRQGDGTNYSSINRPQLNRNFVELGISSPMCHTTHRIGEREADHNGKVSKIQLGCPKEIDGSFLSLGIGDNRKGRPTPKFDSREIASKLNDAVSPQFQTTQVQRSTRIGGIIDVRPKYEFDRQVVASALDEAFSCQFSTSQVEQTTRNSSSMGHNLAGCFSSPVCTADGWTTPLNDVGLRHGASPGLHPTSLPCLQSQPADTWNNFFMPSNMNTGFVDKKDARTVDFDPYKSFQGDQAPSLPFSSTSAGFLHLGRTGFSRLLPESVNASLVTTQPVSNQLQSSVNSPLLRHRESSSGQGHSGQLFCTPGISATQAAWGSQVPKMLGVIPTESSATQAGTNFPFPKRLGVQLHENGAAQVVEGGPYLRGRNLETLGNMGRPQDNGPVQFTKSLLGPPPPIGRPQHNMPTEFSIGLCGPTTTSGQSQVGVPGQFSKDIPRPFPSTGQGIQLAKVNSRSQASDVLGLRSRKRGAMQPPPSVNWVQRRKITPQPIIHPSMPCPRQPPAPAAVHIKWQGFDGPPQPTGQKCRICKRDLLFTPDGPVYQPTIAPTVAVLPCGHTFHDHCLQNITPADQSKDPPCIPCALKET